MIRLQPSWLLESASALASIDSIFFPFIHRYSPLYWFSRRGLKLIVNTPVDSQAMLMRVWLDTSKGPFSEKNRRKFNQVIKKPLELDMNPFRNWNDRLFTRQQLDYLFYWREAAFEIEDSAQREIFWGSVYKIMSYWLSNRQCNRTPAYQPDEIMHLILKLHQEHCENHDTELILLNSRFEDLCPPESILTVFPLVFIDEEDEESQLQAIFHAWYHGHADIEQARSDIKNLLRLYSFSIQKKPDFSTLLKLSEKSKIVALCWSGEELAPQIYEQEIIEPFQREFACRFSRSKFTIKTVNPSADSYDYLLLFFN